MDIISGIAQKHRRIWQTCVKRDHTQLPYCNTEICASSHKLFKVQIAQYSICEKNENSDQTAQMRRLVRVFNVAKAAWHPFSRNNKLFRLLNIYGYCVHIPTALFRRH